MPGGPPGPACPIGSVAPYPGCPAGSVRPEGPKEMIGTVGMAALKGLVGPVGPVESNESEVPGGHCFPVAPVDPRKQSCYVV